MSGAQLAVDGRGDVVVQPQGHAQVQPDRAGAERGLQVRGVGAGQGEQSVGSVDLGRLQYPLLCGVADHDRHAEPEGERDAARFGVLPDADARDAQVTKLGQDAGADLAEAEQDEVPGKAAAGRVAQGCGAAERTQRLQGAGDEKEQQGRLHQARKACMS